MSRYSAGGSTAMNRNSTQSIRRRTSRKISLRRKRIRVLPGELEEHVLERSPLRHDRVRIQSGLHERAVERGAHARLRGDVDAAVAGRDALDAGEAEDRVARGGGRRDLDRVDAPGMNDLRDGSARDEPALLDDEHLVADLLDLVQEMAREQHRAALARELAHERADLALARRIEAVRRLVEDHERRITEQRRRDTEPLAHAEGIRAERAARAVRQPDACERRSTRASAPPPRISASAVRLSRPERYG